jgi:DNA-binding LacI/PurR family transcriptional regulator
MKNNKTNLIDSVYNDISERLDSKQLTSDKPFPSLRELSNTYNVSLGTIRQALLKLQYENRITVKHGKGYSVTPTSGDAKQPRMVLLLNRYDDHLFHDFIDEIQNSLLDHKEIILMIENIDLSPDRLREKLHMMINQGLSTVLFNGYGFDNADVLYEFKDKLDFYCFMSYPSPEQPPAIFCPSVISDWFHGGYIGIKHLIEEGCRNIFLLAGPGAHSTFEAGAYAAREESIGKNINLSRVLSLEELIEHLDEADGVFALGDSNIANIINHINNKQRKIPKDIALLGYYNTPWCEKLSPEISSISIEQQSISKQIVNLMVNRINEVRIVKPKLFIRESTDRRSKS